MMILAFLLWAGVADWVPMRWAAADVKSLDLLRGTAVNCLLIEEALWSPLFVEAARSRNLAVLGIVRPGTRTPDAGLRLHGVVLEGDFPDSFVVDSRFAVVRLPSRARMKFSERPVVGTAQGIWPGIHLEDEGGTKAAPSGAPWIHTNGGFLRFARAAAPGASVWIGNVPPPGNVHTAERYMQAVADAAITGARWIVALDEEFWKRLGAADASAVRDWKKIADQLAWFEAHKEWRDMRTLSLLALVQDVDSGALLSGGVLDMIAVKHTPVKAVPTRALAPASMEGVKMAVNVDPSSLTETQRGTLQQFRRAGGSTLSGPPAWKFPEAKPNSITLSDEEVTKLDEIWKEVNAMTGRRNLGARLFNVSSMLSNLVESADRKHAVLLLVNYSGFPVENVTVHLLARYKTATLLSPGATPHTLPIYDNDEGSGVDIDTVGVTASLVLE